MMSVATVPAAPLATLPAQAPAVSATPAPVAATPATPVATAQLAPRGDIVDTLRSNPQFSTLVKRPAALPGDAGHNASTTG